MKYLYIYDENGKEIHAFPCNRTDFAIIDGKLYVTNRGCQFRFPLDRYTFEVKGKKGV